MIEHLLAIETEAQEAMHDIEKESAVIKQNAQENLARRIAEIEREGAETVRNFVRESEKDTAAKIARAREEWRAKNERLEKHFIENRKKMRGKIFHDILYGEDE